MGNDTFEFVLESAAGLNSEWYRFFMSVIA